MRAGFIWDDDVLLTDNPLVHAPDGWWRLWVTGQMPQYFPITWTSFWLEWRLWGKHPTGYHVTNILLHITGCLLLWRVLARLKIPGSWWAALFFAVHPVNVESVAWISERKNLLALVFFLAAWRAYLGFEAAPTRTRYLAAVGWFILAVLSKSTAVVLPAVLLVSTWWQCHRLSGRDCLRLAPMFVIGLAAGLVSIGLEANRPAPDGLGYVQEPAHPVAWLQGLGHAIGFYLGKALWPVGLAPLYRHVHPDPARGWDYLPTLLCLVAAALLWWKRHGPLRPVFVAAIFYVITLMPVVGLGNLLSWRAAPRADHLQHMSLIAAVALVAGGGTRYLPARWGTVAGSAVVVALGVLTWQQGTIYRDALTYWEAAVRALPGSARAHYNLGVAHLEQRRYAEAELHLQQAVAIRPTHALAHFNLGLVRVATDRLAAARDSFETAVRLAPHRAEFRYNLAKTLAREGRWAEAVAQYEAAFALPPSSRTSGEFDAQAQHELATARYNHGVHLGRQNHWPAAEQQFRLVIASQPGHAAAHYNLAIALLRQNRPAEALPHLETAARLNPSDREARDLLAELQRRLTR